MITRSINIFKTVKIIRFVQRTFIYFWYLLKHNLPIFVGWNSHLNY
jgi:hypothetical protein